MDGPTTRTIVASAIALIIIATLAEAGCKNCGPTDRTNGPAYVNVPADFPPGRVSPASPPFPTPANVSTSPGTRHDLRPLTPPPGNLGRTYRVPTRSIPVDKHPRIGMLEVVPPVHPDARKTEAGEIYVKLSATGMNAYLDDDDNRWHLETEHPMIPGNPLIFDVQAELVRVETVVETKWGKKYEKQIEKVLEHLGYRTVRLIPGRIVEIDWIQSAIGRE